MRRYFKILFGLFKFLATRPTRLLLFIATVGVLAWVDHQFSAQGGLVGWLGEALKIVGVVIMSFLIFHGFDPNSLNDHVEADQQVD